MKKTSLFGIAALLSLMSLSACKPRSNKTEIQFWTGFGSRVATSIDTLIKRFESENQDIRVNFRQVNGGYPALLTAIKQSISNTAYPHIANGYPDHFADYANSNVLINLDSARYINNPDPTIGVDIDQYYPYYLEENKTLLDGNILGLPFNKSTEVMVTNDTFFEVASSVMNDPDIKVPTTWQELAIVGAKLKNVVKSKEWAGKLIKHDGTTVDKPEGDPTPEFISSIAIDMSNLTSDVQFIPFSWDSSANFFITILRQWGAEYTRRGATFQTGTIEFHRGESKDKTLAALNFFRGLAQAGIIGLPSSFGTGNFSSKAFIEARTVLTISSTAGITENLPNGFTPYPFSISANPILYNADLPQNKFVISQGTNLTLFNKGKGNDPKVQAERLASWRLLRYLTYETNHEFGISTSYFPVTDGRMLEAPAETVENYEGQKADYDRRKADYDMYVSFLGETGGTPQAKATREAARLQTTYQQKDDDGNVIWTQFVDPGFIGSAKIRAEVEYVMMKIIGSDSTAQGAIDSVVSQLSDYQ